MEALFGPDFGNYRVIALAIGLAAASVIDIERRSIPNYLTGTLFTVGLCVNADHDGWTGLYGSALGTVVALAIVWLFYRHRWLGGGDVKLFAAIGAVTGPLEPFTIAVYSLAVSSAVTIVIGSYRRANGVPPGLPVTIPMAPVFWCGTLLAYLGPLIPR